MQNLLNAPEKDRILQRVGKLQPSSPRQWGKMDPAQAVTLVLNYVTAYQMLHRVAKVRAGDKALVIGASGGVGTALLDAVRDAAVQAGCRRIWLITTNDNLRALGFYQKRGYRLVAVHRDALQRSRELKPSIPLVSPDGIPLRDEIELEYPVGDPA